MKCKGFSLNKRFALVVGLILLIIFSGFIIKNNLINQEKPISVLFLGNSYTQVNALPEIFQEIAQNGGFARPNVKSYTPGGYTLELHFADPITHTYIQNGVSPKTKWDVVVLQEQSEIPAYAKVNPDIHKSSVNSALSLYRLIKIYNPNARVILFETWARNAVVWKNKSVDIKGVGADSNEMQDRIKNWYNEVFATISGLNNASVSISPVGDLWQINYNCENPILLHQPDGSHPSYAGSYLAALSLFSTIYNTTPQKITFNGLLTESDALSLRNIVTSFLKN